MLLLFFTFSYIIAKNDRKLIIWLVLLELIFSYSGFSMYIKIILGIAISFLVLIKKLINLYQIKRNRMLITTILIYGIANHIYIDTNCDYLPLIQALFVIISVILCYFCYRFVIALE
jgi:hypothetical protein